MKRDQVLLNLVVEEAVNLKKYATKKELSKLDYTHLAGNHPDNCIYGQLTGSCNSARAYRLIRKCCDKVYKEEESADIILLGKNLNGKPKKLECPSSRLDYYSSPIENFLIRYKKEYIDSSIFAKKLIKFLKGEIDELKF